MRAGALVVACLCLGACASEPEPVLCENSASTELLPFDSHRFVAHAGGSPYGLDQEPAYTNSREAFEVSYANGFRVFEFDMITLGDKTVTLAHDGHEPHYGLKIPFKEATREQVQGLRYDGKFELLFAEDLIELMVSHPDIYIITDTKWDHSLIAQTLVDMAPDDGVRDRLVPHLASDEHVLELRDIYPFPEEMIAVYRWAGSDVSIAARRDLYDVDNVMMWWDTRWSEETQATLSAAGLKVWVHTPHEPDLVESFLRKDIRVYSGGYISPCADPS